MRYPVYHDYYQFLQIISTRLEEDYQKLTELTKSLNSIVPQKDYPNGDSEILKIIHGVTVVVKSIQLDNESFVLFCRILLDKLGLLVEGMIGYPSSNSSYYSFSGHKKFFMEDRIKHYNPQYSRLRSLFLIDIGVSHTASLYQ